MNSEHTPKLPDEFGEDVLQFCSEVPPHVILDVPDALHLNTRGTPGLTESTDIFLEHFCLPVSSV